MTDPSTSSSHAIPVNPLDQQQKHTVVHIPPLPMPEPIYTQLNAPCLDLIQGSREHYYKVGVRLYEAAIKGDWKAAKPIIERQPYLIRFAITENHDTLLHIAASTESTKSVNEFVTNLVDMMEKKDLELQNRNGDTALALAASAGNLRTAMTMLDKNRALIEVPNRSGVMPLYMAALFEKPDMVRYLYDISKKMWGDFWDDQNRGWVLQKCIEAEIFDVAIKIVKDHPQLTYRNKGVLSNIILALAEKTEAFEGTKPNSVLRIIKPVFALFNVKVAAREEKSEALQLLRLIWEKIVIMPKADVDDILRGHAVISQKCNGAVSTYPSRVLFVATKMGNTRFIIELIRSNPDLIWKADDKRKTIFHLAVKHRQINIYKLIYEIGSMKDLITPIKDINGNNMLHMVAKEAKHKINQNMSGAALQMQTELLWYKEVEKIIPPSYRKRMNKNGETPQDLMARKHAKLVSKGEDWINYYMLVATLIATIVFAAAFTLPGGYNQNTGIPFFKSEPSLIIFVISDAVSLISSSTSVLIFLSILTSRYAEHDFMESLPSRLMFGIATLFLSITTMMVAFSASFFLLYNEKLKWVPISITCLAGLPVVLFAKMQFHLLLNVFDFTYRSRSHFKPKKRTLYY